MSFASLLLPCMNCSFRIRHLHASLRRCGMIKWAAARENMICRKPHILHGEICSMHLIPLFNCYPPKKEVCKFLTLERFFLCRNKSLDFTSCLAIRPFRPAASPGPLLCSVQECSHQEGGTARRSWLIIPRMRTQLSPGWIWPIDSLLAPPRSLYIQKQLMKESSYKLLILIFIKGGNSSIHSKESDYRFYDRTWVTWHLLI